MLKRQESENAFFVYPFLDNLFRSRVFIVDSITRVVFFTFKICVYFKFEDFYLSFVNRRASKISVYPINTYKPLLIEKLLQNYLIILIETYKIVI